MSRSSSYSSNASLSSDDEYYGDNGEEFRNSVSKLSTTEAWESAFAGSAIYVLDDNNASDLVNKVSAAITLNSN